MGNTKLICIFTARPPSTTSLSLLLYFFCLPFFLPLLFILTLKEKSHKFQMQKTKAFLLLLSPVALLWLISKFFWKRSQGGPVRPRLLVSSGVLISRLWDWVLHWAPCLVEVCLWFSLSLWPPLLSKIINKYLEKMKVLLESLIWKHESWIMNWKTWYNLLLFNRIFFVRNIFNTLSNTVWKTFLYNTVNLLAKIN